jgi:hypothetical protein
MTSPDSALAVAAGIGVARGVGEQVRHDLLEPGRIAVPAEPWLHGDAELVSRLGELRGDDLHGVVDERRDAGDGPTQLDLAAGHPGNVEQSVYQAHEVADLATDDRLSREASRPGFCRMTATAVLGT